jgi:hypothetical protein
MKLSDKFHRPKLLVTVLGCSKGLWRLLWHHYKGQCTVQYHVQTSHYPRACCLFMDYVFVCDHAQILDLGMD